MSTTTRTTETASLHVCWYEIPTAQNNATLETLRDLGARVHSATAELARYGLSGHTLFFVKLGDRFGVVSPEPEFLASLPNPLHRVFSRGGVAPYDQAAVLGD